MRACHASGPGSIPDRVKFPGSGFFGVFLHLEDKCQEDLGPPGSRISFVRMDGCVNCVYYLSCSCRLGGSPGIVLIPHPGRPSMPLCGKRKYVYDSKLIASPDRSSFCKARVA